MKIKKSSKYTYKYLKGIITPDSSDKEHLALLTEEGKVLPLVKNEKSNFLKNLIWESVSIFGRITKASKRECIEVIFYSTSTPPNDILDNEFDHKKNNSSYSIDWETVT
jgi:hypothetical protein